MRDENENNISQMDTDPPAGDDTSFFIEEPQKLANNFFNKDESFRVAKLLSQKYRENNSLSKINSNCNSSPKINDTSKQNQTTIIQPYRLRFLGRERARQAAPAIQQDVQTTVMPRSIITRLEILCKTTYDSDDISVAAKAVDLLVSASQAGCCFLEKYIVMLLNFCLNKHPLSNDKNHVTKVEEIMDRIMIVDFDIRQLTENFKKSEHKLTSTERITQLLKKVQTMLDHREQEAMNWLNAIIDGYFVELATADAASELIERISVHIDHKSALVREIENAKSILKPFDEHLLPKPLETKNDRSRGLPEIVHRIIHTWPHYSIEQIEL